MLFPSLAPVPAMFLSYFHPIDVKFQLHPNKSQWRVNLSLHGEELGGFRNSILLLTVHEQDAPCPFPHTYPVFRSAQSSAHDIDLQSSVPVHNILL